MCGVYNSGFLAIRRSPISEDFLNWWNRKLLLLCYCEPERGLYNEQRWLDMAPSFYDISVFREVSYNVAHWNVSRRNLLKGKKSGSYTVSGKPLRLFHFSQIDAGTDMRYFRKYLGKHSAVFVLREEYLGKVKAFNRNGLSRIPWSYNYYLSGETILDEARIAYRTVPEHSDEFCLPFNESNSLLLARTTRSRHRGRGVLHRFTSLFSRFN
jgi:hypothetical protein